MTGEERALVFEIFAEGCDHRLPENVHVSLDLLRRVSGVPPVEALNMLRGLRSLGFVVEPYADAEHDADDMVGVTWENRFAYDDPAQDDFNIQRSTEVARAVMLGASEDQRRECAHEALKVLDFLALAVPLNAEDQPDE